MQHHAVQGPITPTHITLPFPCSPLHSSSPLISPMPSVSTARAAPTCWSTRFLIGKPPPRFSLDCYNVVAHNAICPSGPIERSSERVLRNDAPRRIQSCPVDDVPMRGFISHPIFTYLWIGSRSGVIERTTYMKGRGECRSSEFSQWH